MIGPTGSRNSSRPSDVAKMKPRLPWMIWRNLSRPASLLTLLVGFFPLGMLTEIPCFGWSTSFLPEKVCFFCWISSFLGWHRFLNRNVQVDKVDDMLFVTMILLIVQKSQATWDVLKTRTVNNGKKATIPSTGEWTPDFWIIHSSN